MMLGFKMNCMRQVAKNTILFGMLLLLPLPLHAEEEIPAVFTDEVARVVDGNVLLLKSGIQVRLIGVRSPSPYDRNWNERLKRDLALQKGGLGESAEAVKEFAKYLVEGKTVRIETDPAQIALKHRDREERLFAYVWFTAPVFPEAPDWLVIDPKVSGTEFRYDALLNACLIRAGFAAMDKTWPFSFGSKFSALESEARENGRGLWEREEDNFSEEEEAQKN